MGRSRKAVVGIDCGRAFVFVPDELLREHIWVTGSSGSEKSVLIRASLVSQMMSREEKGGDASEVEAVDG